MQTPIKVLGIDVGTAINGWSILIQAPLQKNHLQLLEYGVILTSPDQPMPERIATVYEGICQLIDTYHPQHIAIESLFFFKNQKTVMTVSQVRGVILLAAQKAGLQIFEYTPLQVKMGVTGYGRAEKAQVQKMVKLILGLEVIPKPDDAADAIAIAITHLNTL